MSKQLISYFLATALAVYTAITLSSSTGTKNCAENLNPREAPSLVNLTYSQLTEFLLENYDPSLGDNATSLEDKLYNALSGMELAEFDGAPVGSAGKHALLWITNSA
jgi:hypothetical protein